MNQRQTCGAATTFIRDAIKDARQKLTSYNGDKRSLIEGINFVIQEVITMIYREENILFPMAINNFTEDKWVKILRESDEIGYCLIAPTEVWKPERLIRLSFFGIPRTLTIVRPNG